MAQIPFLGMENEGPARQKSYPTARLMIPAKDPDLATEAIENLGGEATIYESESCGCMRKKFVVTVNKGTNWVEMKDPRRRTIVSIVNAERASDIVAAVNEGGSSVIRSPVYGVE